MKEIICSKELTPNLYLAMKDQCSSLWDYSLDKFFAYKSLSTEFDPKELEDEMSWFRRCMDKSAEFYVDALAASSYPDKEKHILLCFMVQLKTRIIKTRESTIKNEPIFRQS